MTELTTQLDHGFLQKHNVRLYGSEVDIYDIINDFLQDNPSEQAFYIVDLGELSHSVAQWNLHLPMVKPYYAVKSNSNLVVLEALASLGVNFDCASLNEIKTILDITGDPKRILYAHPVKMASHIRFARANDVNTMTFDNPEEVVKIKLYHPYANLILRIAVDDSQSECRFSKKFGCKLDQVKELLALTKTLKINVAGFSFHVGSSCGSAESYYLALKDCAEAVEIARQLDIHPSIIDIGGGFSGIDTEKIKFENISQRIRDGIIDFFPDHEQKGISFISEPGRFFSQKPFTLVMNIVGKKIVMEKNGDIEEKKFQYYLNESVYGSYNCIQNDYAKPIILPFNERNEVRFNSLLWGISCDSIDVISNNIMLPELTIGEWVLSQNMGSYTISSSSEGFNGFKTTSFRYILRS